MNWTSTSCLVGVAAACLLLAPAEDAHGSAAVRLEESKSERSDDALLASVSFDGGLVDFVEVKPGVVILRQQGAGKRGPSARPRSLMEKLASTESNEERYRILAGAELDASSLRKVKASDVRRRALEQRYQNGEEPKPRPVRVGAREADASKSSGYGAVTNCDGSRCEQEYGYGSDASMSIEDFDFGGMWCPSEIFDYVDPNDPSKQGARVPVSGHFCVGDLKERGDHFTGWETETKVWSSMAWNRTPDGREASSYSQSKLFIWHGGEWHREFEINYLPQPDAWVMYYSWHPYTFGGINVREGAQDDRLTELFSYAAFWLNK